MLLPELAGYLLLLGDCLTRYFVVGFRYCSTTGKYTLHGSAMTARKWRFVQTLCIAVCQLSISPRVYFSLFEVVSYGGTHHSWKANRRLSAALTRAM